MYALAFVTKYRGHLITAPGGVGGQCVDLVNVYLLEALGGQPVRLNAVDWQHTQVPGFTWTPNTPTNTPPRGSLVVWRPYPPHGIGQYGHIALAIAADPTELLTFDQDWPTGAPCSLVSHDYGGVVGWHQPAG